MTLHCWSARGAARNVTKPCHAAAWSYDHLDDAEKALLERCSVFAGGFDLQSACAVAGFDDADDYAVLDLLDALVARLTAFGEQAAGHCPCGRSGSIAARYLLGSG